MWNFDILHHHLLLNLHLLLFLLLLHTLNLEVGLGFDAAAADDDDDDSFEDPDSAPCAFPLPAFNRATHFLQVGCC